MKCFIVLPCYNEEENVKPLVYAIDRTLRQYIPYEIIAVNDGSTDHTIEILERISKQYPLKLLEHETNEGLAAALQTGLNEAIKCSTDEDFIVTMDADNTHDPRYIKDLIRSTKEADVVVGSRYVTNGRQLGVASYRIIMSKVANFMTRKIMRLPVKDATSGYRCFKASALKRSKIFSKQDFIESKGFEVSLEILAKSFLGNLTIDEVAIVLDYTKKKGGSKMKILLTIQRYLTLLLKMKAWENRFENES